MTRVCFVFDEEHHSTMTQDDPRPLRELVLGINTSSAPVEIFDDPTGLTIGADGRVKFSGKGPVSGSARRRGRLWAMGHPSVNVLTIKLAVPPVRLGRRHFQILFGVADGQSAGQIAQQLGLSRRTIYNEFHELKRRFGVDSKEELLVKAGHLGWI